VWEDKHGINGTKGNKDPGQATKNGYLDFLTRLEQGRPSLSTFIASDWDNIALPLNGGPIFGTAMDAKLAVRVTTESLAAWDAGDEAVTRGGRALPAARQPRRRLRVPRGRRRERPSGRLGDTDLHPRHRHDDGRIGRLLAAIRARPSYPFESWTILVPPTTASAHCASRRLPPTSATPRSSGRCS
jgi:hypothetical protein